MSSHDAGPWQQGCAESQQNVTSAFCSKRMSPAAWQSGRAVLHRRPAETMRPVRALKRVLRLGRERYWVGNDLQGAQ